MTQIRGHAFWNVNAASGADEAAPVIKLVAHMTQRKFQMFLSGLRHFVHNKRQMETGDFCLMFLNMYFITFATAATSGQRNLHVLSLGNSFSGHGKQGQNYDELTQK